MEDKLCNGCNKIKPITDFYFYKTGKQKGKIQYPCKKCSSKNVTRCNHLRGKHRPMNENKNCSAYLGVVIAETALSKFYKHIERMPYGNPGYDFKCDRGYKIDVKSACLQSGKYGSSRWKINIKQNVLADYFLCLLFNNRKDLEPMYVLLVPGCLVNKKLSFSIANNSICLDKWTKYMQPLENVMKCCDKLKESATA